MKTTVITVLLSVLAFKAAPVNASNYLNPNDSTIDTINAMGPVTNVEDMAQFPGGEQELERYVRTHVQYPRIAKEQGIEGRVIVAVVIDENGAISDVEVLQGIGGGCDEEVVRVITAMPAWKPTKQDGKNINTQKIFSFNFQL